MDQRPANLQTFVLTKHAYFDLSHVSPCVFLYLLKACYSYGTCKAAAKFRALQQQVHLVLLNNVRIGAATFVVRCLYILPTFETYSDGLSHLVISALRRFLKLGCNNEDLEKAKVRAARLFLDIVGGTLPYDEGVLIKIIQTFDINLLNIEKATYEIYANRNSKPERAEEVVEGYVQKLIELESYMTAVDILIHFSIHHSGESFLLKLLEHQQFKAAEKWATFMGKQMLCLLVQKLVEQNLLEPAYDIISKNNMRQEFPDLYQQSKESSLKKLAEKGVWEIAEARANGDRQLLEYLVYLAMEAGYFEKVEELCERYTLKGFLNFKEPEANVLQSRYLDLHKLCIEDVVWVDEVSGLHDATCYLEECKVIGLDCEWKPHYEKGSGPSKVSIMQIASEKKVYILDLIKLSNDVPIVLDKCIARIMQSSSILKLEVGNNVSLGYNFQCDIKQLAGSYGELKCFKHFEMLLDIQNVFKEARGGLSGLAEKILGTGLNKTRRNSNWEQRPLSLYQLEYAALDAAVLIHIFRHVGTQTQPADGPAKLEWKSKIISHIHIDNSKLPKKAKKTEGET